MRLLLLSLLLFTFSCKSTQDVKQAIAEESNALSLDTICQVQNSNGKTFGEVLGSHQKELSLKDEELGGYIFRDLMNDRESWLHKEFLRDQKFMTDWLAEAKLLKQVEEEKVGNWFKNLEKENPACFQMMLLSMNIVSTVEKDK